MKTVTLAASALVLAALLQTPVQAQKGRRSFDNAAKHGWLSGLGEGKQQAKKTGKPLMVVLRCQP